MPSLIISNGPYAAFARTKPKSRFAKTVVKAHREFIETILADLRHVDPATADPQDIAAMLAALILCDVPQSEIASRLGISKTTIGRWLIMETPPRPLSRETIVKRLQEMLIEVRDAHKENQREGREAA